MSAEAEEARRRADKEAIRWIAAALNIEPHQVGEVMYYPHNRYVDVLVGGKTHRLTIDKVREAKRDHIKRTAARAEKHAENIRSRVDEAVRRGEIKPFVVLRDGTIDLHPSQWKEIRA